MKILIAISLFIVTLFAHPHTFMDIYPTIKVNKDKTASLHFAWKFDEMTSAMLIMEVDTNGDGKIDKEENQFILENYFASLKDYSFYTDVFIGKKAQDIFTPTNFQASIENNRLIYAFDIKENYPTKGLKIDLYDEDFFVATVLKKEFITVKGGATKIVELDRDSYFGYRLEVQ